MSFETFLRDAAAVRDRGDWLAELYLENPAGAEEVVRVSRRGTATGSSVVTAPEGDTIAAHTPFRKRIITAPAPKASLWQSGRILSRSLPGASDLVLGNADRGLDQYRPEAGWKWAGKRVKVFFADTTDVGGTIGKIFDGRLGTPRYTIRTKDGSPVTVPLVGREGDFAEQISRRVHRGTSYELELFGDRTVSYGTPSAVNITGNMTGEMWLWLEGLPSVDRRVWGWVGATTYPWRLGFLTTGAVVLVCTIGGVTESVTSAFTFSTLRPYHFSFVVSGRDVTFERWDDDAQVLTTDLHVNAFSSATRQGNSGGTYLLRTDSDATFKPWFDEMRVWNVALSKTERAANRFRPLAPVPATCVHRCGMDDGAGTTVTDSSATAAHGTISGAGTSTWLWAWEGGPELAGTPKGEVWGEKWGVQPKLVAPIHSGYQVAGGGKVKSIASFEGGNPHTMVATAASFRAFKTTTPAAGTVLPYLARGLFRMAAIPTLPIAATVEGYDGGALGYVSQAGTISRDIATRRPPLVADPAGIDTASFTSYATDAPAKMGLFLPAPVSVGEALDKVNVGAAGWWGLVRASTLLHVERFKGPAVTAAYSFDSRHIKDIDPIELKPIHTVTVKFRRNFVVLSEDQVAAAVKGTVGWQAWTQEWQEQPATDDETLEDYPGDAGQTVTVETCLELQEDARALADSLLALLKGLKEGYVVTVRATGLLVKVGDTVTLTATLQDGTVCQGLDGTKKYVVLSAEDLKQRGEVRLEVWG